MSDQRPAKTAEALLAERIGPVAGDERHQVATEIPLPFRRRGYDSGRVGGEIGLAGLLEAKEEESFAFAVVNLGNPDRPNESDAVIVLAHGVADVLAFFGWVDATSVGKRQA